MAIYAQHGYGKTDKIESGLEQRSLSGVILSPRDESPDNLIGFATSLRDRFGQDLEILLDPQFYAATISGARDGHLSAYPFYEPGLTRARLTGLRDIQRHVKPPIEYQAALNLSRIISPSVLISGFDDAWSQIALAMGKESMAAHQQLNCRIPLHISLIVDEIAFRNRETLDDFLDMITGWDVSGFYLVVRRNDVSYPALYEEEVLSNLIYFVHSLSTVNRFDVICGYSDLPGLLLHAVGASVTGTGWHNSLRQFSLNRFLPATGGRQARARYTSLPLLNCILVVPEMTAVQHARQLDHILSRTSHDGAFRAGNAGNVAWSPEMACLHHWEVLARVDREIDAARTIRARVDLMERKITDATAVYASLENAGIPFEAATGPRHLRVWLKALRSFRGSVGL